MYGVLMFFPLYLSTQLKKLTATAFFALCFFFLFVSLTFAAEVQIAPSTGSYAQGQTFTATVRVNPSGKSINAVEGNLSFDTSKLAVVSVSKTGSAFSLWTTEPTFSNTAGTITFGGGSPTPFSGQSTLITVTLRAVAEGSAKVSVSSASVLAADGLGTDVYISSVDATYTITGLAEPTPVEPTPTPTPTTPQETTPSETDAAITFGEPPRAPEIGSLVFLDPEVWYNTKLGTFTWELPFDVDSLAFDIATSSEFEPVTIIDPPVSEFSVDETMVYDGIQYVTMQFKNQVGWGAILHRKLLIDTVPPEAFAINVRAGNAKIAFPLLTFEAYDEHSGIIKYVMTIADNEPFDVTPDEAKLGYLLGELEDGSYTVRVVAYDKAGNKTESSVPVLITAGWHPPVEAVSVLSIWDFFSGKNLIIILLLLVILGQFIYIIVERKRQRIKDEKLRKETREVQDQMEKIFSALRDEIYDQINAITKRPRLSKHEKEAVEGLSQALEVSETLIEKEITDVGKILK
jgi:hypothetical protein